MDYPKFQYSEFSPDGSKGQIVVRGDDAVQWAEDIKIALKVFPKQAFPEDKGPIAVKPEVDMSKVPQCPKHHKPFTLGKFGWYCQSKDDSTPKGWCVLKPDKAKDWV